MIRLLGGTPHHDTLKQKMHPVSNKTSIFAAGTCLASRWLRRVLLYFLISRWLHNNGSTHHNTKLHRIIACTEKCCCLEEMFLGTGGHRSISLCRKNMERLQSRMLQSPATYFIKNTFIFQREIKTLTYFQSYEREPLTDAVQ
jgi:hypothetical protein